MTRQKFLQEVILRLTLPDFINIDAKHIVDNWKLPYDPQVVVNVIARINLDVITKSTELDKFAKDKELDIDPAILYFNEKSYKDRINKKFGL